MSDRFRVPASPCVIAALACACGACVPGDYDLHDPALTPIVEKAKPAGEPVTLVKDGKVTCAIVANRHFATHRGALKNAYEAITNAFGLATGAVPELIDPAETNRWSAQPALIVLGRSDLALAAGVDVTKLPDDGFAVKSFELKLPSSTPTQDSNSVRGIVVAGLDSQMVREWKKGPLDTREASKGTLFAAYDFLERFLSARFFFPGRNGTLVPKCANLTIRPVHYEDAPYFQRRGHGYFYVREFITPDRRAKWAKYLDTPLDRQDNTYGILMDSWRLGGTQQFFGMHSPDPQRWSKVHPDKWDTMFYTTPSGNFMHDMKNHIGNYYKVTDLGLADMLVEDWKDYFASSGKVNRCCSDGYIGRDFVSFGVCDTFLEPWDAIPDPVVRAEKLITRADLHGDDNRMVMRNVYGRFYSHICKRLKKELPGVHFGIMAYYNAREAPTDPRYVPLPDNFEVIVCDGSLLSFIMDRDARAKSYRLIDGWYKALGNRPVQRLWLYAGTGLGCLSPEYLGEIPKLYGPERIGRGGFFLEFEPAGEFWHYFYVYYVASKLKWNPNCNVDAIVKDLFVRLYGPKVAEPLLKFHALLKANGEKYIMPTLLHPETPPYPLADLATLQGYLDAAKAAAGNDELLLKRVGLLADCWPKIFDEERKKQEKKGAKKNAQEDNPAGTTVERTTMDGEPNGDVQTFKMWGRPGERWLTLLVSNAHATYPLSFAQFRSGDSWGAQNSIHGRRSHGFFSHGTVFWPKVNGADMRSVVYRKDLAQPYADGAKKGWEMAFELGGVPLKARYYMTPDDRTVTIELVRDPSAPPAKAATVTVEGIPSVTTLDKACKGKTRRELRTATRLLQEPGGALTADDRFFIFQDGVYDGTSEEKGYGPVAIVPDFTGVEKAACDVRAKERNVKVTFTLKPDFTVFRYRVFEETFRRHANDELFNLMKSIR